MSSSLYIFLFIFPFLPPSTPSENLFRLMTFNVWQSGRRVENGQQKIVNHIRRVNPDVVALQEANANIIPNLILMLGHPWQAVEQNPRSTTILTRHVIAPNTNISTSGGVGVKIILPNGKLIGVWSLHLDYRFYKPYAANNMIQLEQVLAGENKGRVPQIHEIFALSIMKKWLEEVVDVPIFITGDFNSPSHLDWTEETRDLHGDWVVRWPTTMVIEDRGFVDTYRKIYPNVVQNPGITWSTVYKFNEEWNYTEPQDRIDFLFYKGPVVPTHVSTYSGSEDLQPQPYHVHNDFPSDHFAVFADYKFS